MTTTALVDIQGVITDMDGVLWRGGEPLPGLVPFFQHLAAHDLPYVLATNNSTHTPDDYVARLAELGVPGVPTSAIVSSGTATADTLRATYPNAAATRVYVFGEHGLRHLIASAGFTLADAGPADVVVLGLNRSMTYADLERAATLVRDGAAFVATNDDATFPTPHGLAPGNGAFVAAVRVASGCEPLVVGKPHRAMFAAALARLGTAPDATLMIGDRLDTDVLGAQQAGLRTALVFSGVTTPDALVTSAIQPDVAYDDLAALVTAWRYTGGKRLR